MKFKEKWHEYSRNFTNTTEPIQYEEFVKLEQFGRVLSLPFLLLIFIGLLAFDIQGPAMIAVFASYFLVIFILTYSVHVRMFHARGRSPLPFQVLHILGFISCFIYFIYSTVTHQEANFAALAGLILIPSLTTMGNYFLK
ncbi:hypothetical protein [Macrococcus bovicus]|uniref:Uncharacterized protein n=1 Tax=Macrococcus bovicus TaxID=69968 RepID=A0A4R6C2Z9_9STAP|nr:hypothetical protein [Macrococcus bovicus]TDM15757.1 hypothetical protein ERX55_02290 [Macrococcus bovicus]